MAARMPPMQALTSLPVALIGGGNMARGLIGGLLGAGVPRHHITVADPGEPVRTALARDFGVQVTEDNAAAARGARVVILAVKPQLMATVATALAHALVHRPLVISVAAGIRTTDLARWLGDLALPLVRAMPNRPALVGAGASGLYADASLGGEARELAMTVLAGTGLCLWVENEAELDIVTALSGSGPAYFFRLAELMAQAAVAQGLAPEVARQLAAQTLAGAGRLVAAEARPDLARMRAEVTSPGGTTEAALKTFDAQGLPALVQAAQDAALRRSRELAAPAGNP